MKWEILFVVIIIIVVLLIICYILMDKAEKKLTADKRCSNCKTKQRDDFKEIRCRNRSLYTINA